MSCNYNIPSFTVDDSGVFFVVLIFDEFVIKVPRERNLDQKVLQRMADTQNELAGLIEGVLPCHVGEGYLHMPRAKGVRLREYTRKQGRPRVKTPVADKLKVQMITKAREHGYDLSDMSKRNLFYDEEEQKLYLVDFHQVKKIK